MNKSVYSIVLADEVVDAIDRMAYSMNTSRSNLINQILAERVSLQTPEMRMRGIFSAIQQLADPRFQFLAQPSDAMISLKSPIRYKYKPTLRYSIELSRNFGGKVGRLKVQFRTQSAQLISAAESFFDIWYKIESKYLAKLFTKGVPAKAADGKYVRDFYSPAADELSDDQIAAAIVEYIQLTDKCVQLYFDGLSQGMQEIENTAQIEGNYAAYLKKGVPVL